MRFFTWKLYKQMQAEPGTLEEEKFNACWKKACEGYQLHLTEIMPRLPGSMRKFGKLTLHDGLILTATRTAKNSAVLEIDGNNCCWGPIGQFKLEFAGVRKVTGLSKIVGDWWLYEEVHLHRKAGFEYRVLLARSEFRIVADAVRFTVVAKGKQGNPSFV